MPMVAGSLFLEQLVWCKLRDRYGLLKYSPCLTFNEMKILQFFETDVPKCFIWSRI